MGMNNNFYELYQHAQGAEDWFNYKAKASDTKIVDNDELVKAKEVMGEKKYLQEFECDWIAKIGNFNVVWCKVIFVDILFLIYHLNVIR